MQKSVNKSRQMTSTVKRFSLWTLNIIYTVFCVHGAVLWKLCLLRYQTHPAAVLPLTQNLSRKFLNWDIYLLQLDPGYRCLVKKTSRKYYFPLNHLRHYFYFLHVRVSNIMKFWFICSVNWVLSAVFLQPFFQNSLLFAKQTLFGLVRVNVFRTIGK